MFCQVLPGLPRSVQGNPEALEMLGDWFINLFMIEAVAQHRHEIAAICRKYGVRKLELFGSAANGTFDPAISDVDFFTNSMQT